MSLCRKICVKTLSLTQNLCKFTNFGQRPSVYLGLLHSFLCRVFLDILCELFFLWDHASPYRWSSLGYGSEIFAVGVNMPDVSVPNVYEFGGSKRFGGYKYTPIKRADKQLGEGVWRTNILRNFCFLQDGTNTSAFGDLKYTSPKQDLYVLSVHRGNDTRCCFSPHNLGKLKLAEYGHFWADSVSTLPAPLNLVLRSRAHPSLDTGNRRVKFYPTLTLTHERYLIFLHLLIGVYISVC